MESLDIATESGWSTSANVAQSGTNEESTIIDEKGVSPGVSKVSSQNTMLLDADDMVTPNQIKGEKPIWRHPLPRTALVVVGVGAIGLSVIHLTQGNGAINPQPSQVVQQSPAPVAVTSVSEGDDVKAGKLQAKIATLEQKQQLEQLKNNKQSPRVNPNTVQPSPTVKPKVQPTATVAPVAATPPRPAVVAYSQPRRVYSQPIPIRRIPAAPSPAVIPKPIRTAVATPVPKLDPMEQSLAAANVGSYGSTSPTTSSPPSTANSGNYQTANAQSTNEDDSDWQTSRGVVTPPPEVSNASQAQSNSTLAGANVVDEQDNTNLQAVSYSSPGNSLIVGTKANGKLATPIAWTGRLENPTQNFLIELNEPLKSANNTVAIPSGTYLVAKVISATEAGLLQMSVSSMLVNSNGQTVERAVPEGALLILGKGGRPLKASAERPGSGGSNLGTVILSGISSATGLINQPSSQSIINSGGGYQSTITNGNPNYLAGFGQGAAQALLQQAQNRNQQAVRYRQSEPTVFSLNQGSSVQVFVNQSVPLGNL